MRLLVVMVCVYCFCCFRRRYLYISYEIAMRNKIKERIKIFLIHGVLPFILICLLVWFFFTNAIKTELHLHKNVPTEVKEQK